MRRHEITDRQWAAISSLLSGKATDSGATAKDNRLFFNAVVWIMRTGCPWAVAPLSVALPDNKDEMAAHWRSVIS